MESYLTAVVPAIALIAGGIALQRVKFLKPAFKLLNLAAIWVILPSVVFISVGKYTLRQISHFKHVAVLAVLGLGFCFVIASALAIASRASRSRSFALVLNSAFMNVGYLGLPLVYAVAGPEGLGPASLYAVTVGVPHLVFGVAFASSLKRKRLSLTSLLARVVTFPAVFAVLLAMLFVSLKAPLPPGVPSWFNAYLSKPFFALMLLLVGYQTPLVNPLRYARELAMVSALRLLLSPLLTYFCIGALRLSLVEDISPKPALIQSAMPPAVFNVILAKTYGLDLKLYGTLVLYPTLLSIFIALPALIHLVF